MIKKIGNTTLEWHGDKIKEQSKEEVKKAMGAIGLLVQGSATPRAPVDLGNLKNSITYEETDTEVTIGTNVEYAPYMEYGFGQVPPDIRPGEGDKFEGKSTKKKGGGRPQPFLRPALDENIENINRIILDALVSAFRKGGGR